MAVRSAAAVAIVAVLTAGCAGVAPLPGKGSGAASAPLVSTAPPTGAKGGSPPPVAGITPPSVTCSGSPGASMALVGTALWDVTDPVHPRLVCRILNTTAHLFTEDTFQYVRANGQTTEVVLHSIGSGNESVIAGWPLGFFDPGRPVAGDWTADGNTAAAMPLTVDSAGNDMFQVWLFRQPSKTELYQFAPGLADCVCRFGLPPATLAFSADGEYLASGWPVGKGASPIRVYRVADGALLETLDITDYEPMWSRTGHELLIATGRSWSPENGLTGQAGAAGWANRPDLSPDGTEIAYTNYADATSVRVYVYELSSGKARMLTDASRSDVTFVKDGWVWYDEEAACADCPGGSRPTGQVFAMELSTGVEQPVVFADAGPHDLAPARFWPNT